MSDSFENFEGYKNYKDLYNLNQSLEDRAFDMLNDIKIKPGNDYCIGIVGSDAKNENINWDPIELIIFTKNIEKFITSTDCYTIKQKVGSNSSNFHPEVEIKSFNSDFSRIFVDNTIDDNARLVPNFISPDRLLNSKVIAGNPQLRTKIAHKILYESIDKKVFNYVKNYIKTCEKICLKGYQIRSNEKIVHIDYQNNYIHYNAESHRGVKESTIRGIQNLLVLKELQFCQNDKNKINQILSFNNDISSRLKNHYDHIGWLNSDSRDKLIKIYQRSIEIHHECHFTYFIDGLQDHYSKIKLSDKDAEMFKKFSKTLKEMRTQLL